MDNISRSVIAIILLLSSLNSSSQEHIESNCPLVEELHRTPGEYSWRSRAPGWEGLFFSPRNAQGNSTQLLRFREARWIQLNNLPTSDGYIQCDYIGNIGDELIRFAMADYKVALHPNSLQWTQEQRTQFPSVQAICAGSETECTFIVLKD